MYHAVDGGFFQGLGGSSRSCNLVFWDINKTIMGTREETVAVPQ